MESDILGDGGGQVKRRTAAVAQQVLGEDDLWEG